ncbi:NADH:flavin oxidoreductase [Novosphingobium malaysiense]|uniref:1,2-oxophytodienoate reductase n=1 Tax=Novosphingobium malaysiense TaxID=1348853 RepID=A0A0B1ZJ36_9SPHN|nr:NADH:flavin oxidoreductase [Novosphingobium malaysiense]KHK89186.1 1,2-oxophytodienoate reductase [Novosphingobium malaysiense]
MDHSASLAKHRLDGLLTPLSIGTLTIANRFVMAPMTREKSVAGAPGQDVAAYYRRRAENDVGLIITEGVGIDDPAAVDTAGVPHLYGESPLAGWEKVVTAVHAAGGKIIPQLWHQGAMRDAAISPAPDVGPLRPSGVIGPWGKVSLESDKVARLSADYPPMTDSQIADVIAAYARSAANAARLGFDGIAIHAGHGYLIDNFLWHGTNRRPDRWGADRSLFAAEVVRAIRKAIGDDLPIVFRFSQFKMQDYMASLAETPDELGALLQPIADAGVDVFDGSQRFFDTPIFEGSPLNLGGWAKKLTGKLGMCVGGVGLDKGQRDHHVDSGSAASNNLDRLVARFEKGEFDLVGVGRSLLNDPAWVRRAIRGEPFLPFDNANLDRLT